MLLANGQFSGAPNGIVYDEIWIHCDGIVDVDVIGGPGNYGGGTYDIYGNPYEGGFGSVTIWQLPEPMTLTLLGLGGLALIRRRK